MPSTPIPILLCTTLTLAACDLADPGQEGNLVPLTVADDPTLPAVDLAGIRFHVETFGSPSDPPIIFLHGGPGGDYRGLLRLRGRPGEPRLEDDHFLIFWDQRGCGLSQRHDAADIDMDVYLADLDAIIDHYAHGQRPVLVGHSWGGMYAAAYLDRSPDRIAAAILLEPGPLTGALFEEKKGGIVHFELGAEWANDYLWDQRFLSPEDHARLDYALLLGRGVSQPGYHRSTDDPEPIWRMGAVAQRALLAGGTTDGVATWDFTTHTRDFAGPVAIVASAWNEVVGVDFQTRQAAFFAAPTLTVIDGAGHDFPWTRPDETIAVIRDTLARVANGGGQ